MEKVVLPRFISAKFKFWAFISMVSLVFVHGYNLHERYLEPSTTLSETMTPTSFIELLLTNSILRFRIPMLFIISGFLYALHDSQPNKKRLKKRLLTLVIPYLIWCTFGMIFTWLLEMVPYTRQLILESGFFQKDHTNVLLHDYNWRVLLYRWLVFPVSYQFWFIRVLFIYNLAYPLIRWITTHKYAREIFFTVAFLLWLLNFKSILVEGEGLLYFSLGVWIQKTGYGIEKPRQWQNPQLWSFLFVSIALLKTWLAFQGHALLGDLVYPLLTVLHKVIVFSGLIACWYALDGMVDWCMNKSWFVWLSAFSFIIYSVHAPLIAFAIDGMLSWFHPLAASRALTFMILPLSILALCIGLGALLRKITPRTYALLTGGRGFVLITLLLSATMLNSCHSKPELTFPAELNKHILISSDSNKIVFASNQSGYFTPWLLTRTSPRDSFQMTILPVNEQKDFFPESFSRDGHLISMVAENLLTRDYDIYLYDLNNHALHNITLTDHIDDSSPEFSPSEDLLAFLSNFHLTFYDYASNSFRSIPAPDSTRFRNLVLSAKGKRIYLEDDSTNIWKYEKDQNKISLLWKAPHVSDLTSRMITPDRDIEDLFYFISDHESDFNQIYRCDQQGKAKLFIASNKDKYLIQRPLDSNSFYYKCSSEGNVTIEKFRHDSLLPAGPASGVSYDYLPNPDYGNLLFYSDLVTPATLFLEKNGKRKNILPVTSLDSLPAPRIFHNEAGMINYAYLSGAGHKGWVIWLHGGPYEQMSARYNTYLVQLIDAGWNVIVLNYPGSTGIGNKYELRGLSPTDLLTHQIRTIRQDIQSMKKEFPDLQHYSIIGVSHGTIAAHAYCNTFKNEVNKQIDFSGIALHSDTLTSRPTLYIYGEYDFSLLKVARVRLVDEDLKRGIARRILLRNEGHVINHRQNIQQIIIGIDSFLAE